MFFDIALHQTYTRAVTTPRVFLIMKIAATALMVAVIAVLFFHSKLHEEVFVRQKRLEIPEAGPKSARPPAFDFLVAQNTSLSALKGKVVHINFWAAWCEPCQRELPLIEQLAKQHSDKLQVVLINLDPTPEEKTKARDWLKNVSPTPLALFDNTEKLKIDMAVPALPYHLVIDKEGLTAAAFVGGLDSQQEKFKILLRQLLAE